MKYLSSVLVALLVVVPLSASAVYLDTSTGANVNVGSGAGVNASTDAEVHTTAGGADAGGSGALDASVQVGADDQAETDLEGYGDFGATVMAENESVSDVGLAADGGVLVAYQHDGWLFGFIPVTITSKTTVTSETDGSAKAHVTLPWWSVFVSGVSKIRADAEAALNANADVEANASVQTSADARVKLVEAIVTAVQNADVAVKASYNVKANVK